MEFLAMIIALSLQQVLQPGNALQRDGLLLAWEHQLAEHIDARLPRVTLVLGSVALLVSVLLSLFDDWLFALPELLASAALLLWSLGRGDYHGAVERCRAGPAADPGAADATASGLWMPPIASEALEAGTAQQREERADSATSPADTASLPLLERVAYAGYARWFAPLFWFALLGPVAAVLYRALARLAASGRWRDYGKLLHFADWLPARLLGLSFALTGDFAGVSRRDPLRYFSDSESASRVICELAVSACGDRPDLRSIADLLYRSAGLWLAAACALLLLA